MVPRSLAGFYYHPRLVAVVHLGLPLLTLGLAFDWILVIRPGGTLLAVAVALGLVQLRRLIQPHQFRPVEHRESSLGRARE